MSGEVLFEPTELRGQMLKQEAGINSKLSVFHNGQVFNLHKNSLNLRIHKKELKAINTIAQMSSCKIKCF